MIEVLGVPPAHMIEAGTKMRKLFAAEGDHFVLSQVIVRFSFWLID